MESLTVLKEGSVISKDSQKFVVKNKGEILLQIASYNINSINIIGYNQITTQAIMLALENGIDINFISEYGKYKGKIKSNKSKNIELRLKQYQMYYDEEFKNNIAKIIVKNKLINQYKLLNYYKIKENELMKYVKAIDKCNSINEIMGYEGIGSRLYFNNLSKVIPDPFSFKGRSRRPPKDEVNALLSLTYQITLSKINASLEVQGLDTALGCLHSIKYGRDSLTLDILEEFRQSFCDHLVIKVLKRNQLKKSDFILTEEKGYSLNKEAFKEYLKIFNTEYKAINDIVSNQCQLIRKALEGEGVYSPYTFIKRG